MLWEIQRLIKGLSFYWGGVVLWMRVSICDDHGRKLASRRYFRVAAWHLVTVQTHERVKGEGRVRREWWIGFYCYIWSSKTTERL